MAPRVRLLLIVLLAAAGFARPAAAQSPHGAGGTPACTPEAPCTLGGQRAWSNDLRSGTVTPASGGVLADAATRFQIQFPPGAVSSATTVTYQSGLLPTPPLEGGMEALGYFTLEAFDADGKQLTSFAAPWTVDVEYADCSGPAGVCALALIDEASLHCRFLDESSGEWQQVASQVDVFANRLTCSADHFTHFVVAAEHAATSGETNFHSTYLPLIVR